MTYFSTLLTYIGYFRVDIEDDLSELRSEAVPDEVRKWLASTFAKQEQVLAGYPILCAL